MYVNVVLLTTPKLNLVLVKHINRCTDRIDWFPHQEWGNVNVHLWPP